MSSSRPGAPARDIDRADAGRTGTPARDAGAERTGGSTRAVGTRGDKACVSAGSVVTSRRSDPLAERTSLSFTEVMTGFYVDGAPDPRVAARSAAKEPLLFRLTITVDDMRHFLADPEHLARAEGWIDTAARGGRRAVERGRFNLFAPVTGPGALPDETTMRYRLHYTDADRRPRTLAGWKEIKPGSVTSLWPATTTLYYRVLDGHAAPGEDSRFPVVGAGMLRIRATDFLRQLTTFRTRGRHGAVALLRFAAFFAGRLWRVYRPRLRPRRMRDR